MPTWVAVFICTPCNLGDVSGEEVGGVKKGDPMIWIPETIICVRGWHLLTQQISTYSLLSLRLVTRVPRRCPILAPS